MIKLSTFYIAEKDIYVI